MEKQNAWSMSLMLTMAAEAAVGATSRHEPETWPICIFECSSL